MTWSLVANETRCGIELNWKEEVDDHDASEFLDTGDYVSGSSYGSDVFLVCHFTPSSGC